MASIQQVVTERINVNLQEAVEAIVYRPCWWICPVCLTIEPDVPEGRRPLPCKNDGSYLQRLAWQTYARLLEKFIEKRGGYS